MSQETDYSVDKQAAALEQYITTRSRVVNAEFSQKRQTLAKCLGTATVTAGRYTTLYAIRNIVRIRNKSRWTVGRHIARSRELTQLTGNFDLRFRMAGKRFDFCTVGLSEIPLQSRARWQGSIFKFLMATISMNAIAKRGVYPDEARRELRGSSSECSLWEEADEANALT